MEAVQITRARVGWVLSLTLAAGLHCGAAAAPRVPERPKVETEAHSGTLPTSGLDASGSSEFGNASVAAKPRELWTDRGLMPQPERRPEVNGYWLGAGRRFEDTLRGDWDTPAALLVVYNSTWKRALGRLLSIAHADLPVYVLATPKDARSREFDRWLRRVPFAGLVSIDLDTPWIRDYGPLEVVRPRGISWLDLSYAPDDRPFDDAVPTLLGEVFETSNQREQLPLDGGGIISNGTGLCGITEASFQPLGVDTSDPEQVERFLETIGCRTLALLPELPSESTGHVDMVAQFLAPNKVAIAVPTRRSPPEVRLALERARQALELAAVAHGQA